MREVAEFRIPEEYARIHLEPGQGVPLGSGPMPPSVRKLVVSTTDPLYQKIGELSRAFLREGKFFFHGWDIRRYYSKEEIAAAELFQLFITAVFEPEGEECGTVYDYSEACEHCGFGRRQVSDLVLDLRKVPKSKDIAETISGDEWIVNQRLADLLVDAGATGFELRPVRHRARYEDDPIDLKRYPSGQELLRRAEECGLDYWSWQFWVWVNKREQSLLLDRAREERRQAMEARERRGLIKRPPVWYQLVVTSRRVPVVPPTQAGIEPFDEDPEGRYRCPRSHLLGLSLLSELWLSREGWDGSDIACTAQAFGARMGVFVPSPRLLISPRLRKLFEEHRIKGYRVEVAHLL